MTRAEQAADDFFSRAPHYRTKKRLAEAFAAFAAAEWERGFNRGVEENPPEPTRTVHIACGHIADGRTWP